MRIPNSGSFKKGNLPWNTGTIGIKKSNSGSFKLGERNGITTEFSSESSLAEKNVNWKGDKVGYAGVHSWVYRQLGKAEKCVDCGSTKNIQWANISKKYKRDLTDWKTLCCVCHRAFDGITKLSKEQVVFMRAWYKNGVTQKTLAVEFGITQSAVSRILNNEIKFYG